MPQDSYRCESCVDTSARCEPCRARRAQRAAELRASRRAAGLCVECGAHAVRRGGQKLARCRVHLERNARNSSASHARARKAAE
jgi:hypothetical protein